MSNAELIAEARDFVEMGSGINIVEADRLIEELSRELEAAEQRADQEPSDAGCAHEACEIDTAGNPTRCADCGDYLDSVPDRGPSDADFNRAAQTFYEASRLNLPHTSKPEIVAGVRAAWDALIAARRGN